MEHGGANLSKRVSMAACQCSPEPTASRARVFSQIRST